MGVAAVLLLPFARAIEPVLSRVEQALTIAATGIIIFVMLFVCAEVFMRYVFNSPIPGHLEGSELLMPVIVFFALSYTQSVHGHVGMTMVVDSLSEANRRRLESVTIALSMFIFAVLTYFSAAQAYRSYIFDDVTMTPPYFKIWPSAAAVPLGFFLCTLRMYLQVLKRLYPTRFWFPDKRPPGAVHD
ncbi:MAG TPA: TRAP transporter small permease [Mariprofundaceae bacterium]|nr:TRAP transporter small permease [Mariprofundaceae bacterium]